MCGPRGEIREVCWKWKEYFFSNNFQIDEHTASKLAKSVDPRFKIFFLKVEKNLIEDKNYDKLVCSFFKSLKKYMNKNRYCGTYILKPTSSAKKIYSKPDWSSDKYLEFYKDAISHSFQFGCVTALIDPPFDSKGFLDGGPENNPEGGDCYILIAYAPEELWEKMANTYGIEYIPREYHKFELLKQETVRREAALKKFLDEA